MINAKRSFHGACLLVFPVAIASMNACDRPETEPTGRPPSLVSTTQGQLSVHQQDTASYTAMNAITEERIGTRIYPGAEPKDGGSWQLTDALSEGTESLLVANFRSEDPVDKLVTFYTREFKLSSADVLSIPTPRGTRFSITTQNAGRGTTNILLESEDNRPGTRIKITRMGGRLTEAEKVN